MILDLEDAVAPDAKASARDQVVAAVKTGGFGAREVFIRVNGIDTPWFADDIRAAIAAAPDAILIPKVSTPDQPERIGARLLSLHANLHTRIWAMIETPTAIFNVREIAATAKDSETRLSGFVMGTNDLAKETRARLLPGRAPMVAWLTTCVLAARENGNFAALKNQSSRIGRGVQSNPKVITCRCEMRLHALSPPQKELSKANSLNW